MIRRDEEMTRMVRICQHRTRARQRWRGALGRLRYIRDFESEYGGENARSKENRKEKRHGETIQEGRTPEEEDMGRKTK